MRSLTIEPIGGLANRMRVIAAGNAMAAHAGVPLHVTWKLDPTCNCRFTELFEVPDGIVVHDIDLNRLPIRLLHRAKPLRVKLSGGCYLGSYDVELMCSQNIDFKYFDVTGPLYLSTCMDFVLSGVNRPNLVPAMLLRHQIAELSAGFDKQVVGVHIRRTDNRNSQTKSPTTAFVSMMRAELARDPNVKFFLATDDLIEEERMRSLFPGKVLTHRKRSINRNDPESIKDALIDLYCLAKTTKIIGSYWSSFSEIAACLEGLELVIASELGR